MAHIRNEGRYSRVNDAVHPGPALPKTGDRPHTKIRVGAVIEPGRMVDEAGRLIRRRQRVAINIHSDALEIEHAYGRLSQGAYQAGRVYQSVLEVSRGRSGGGGASFEPKDHGNSIAAHEWAIMSSLDRARAAVDMVDQVRRAVGLYAETVLSIVLADGATLKDAAIALGYRGERSTWGRRKVAGEFREALEDIAREWDRRGWPFVGA
ncbi:MAG: hypothetical protein K2Y29_00510 [Beijerinckiaceae bacterium]|nr:hypothetical protein [Beijerinckiaceae bacterium]